LSKEEYNTKILFDKEGLLQVQELDSSLLHELTAAVDQDESSGLVAFHFGDLLVHVPLLFRIKWKPFYRGMKTENISFNDNYFDKLLFFDFKSKQEAELASRYWQMRVDNYYD
jgi:hypothetical protein